MKNILCIKNIFYGILLSFLTLSFSTELNAQRLVLTGEIAEGGEEINPNNIINPNGLHKSVTPSKKGSKSNPNSPSKLCFLKLTFDNEFNQSITLNQISVEIFPENILFENGVLNRSISYIIPSHASISLYVSYSGILNGLQFYELTGDVDIDFEFNNSNIIQNNEYLTVTFDGVQTLDSSQNNYSARLSNSTNNNEIKVYPNKTIESFNLELILNENSDVEISIFNSLGKKIKTLINNNLIKGKHLFRNNLSKNLSPGLYYIKSNINDKIITKKLIKI